MRKAEIETLLSFKSGLMLKLFLFREIHNVGNVFYYEEKFDQFNTVLSLAEYEN